MYLYILYIYQYRNLSCSLAYAYIHAGEVYLNNIIEYGSGWNGAWWYMERHIEGGADRGAA